MALDDDTQLAAARDTLDDLELEELDPDAPARELRRERDPGHDGCRDALRAFIDRASRTPLLTADEEIALARRIRAGDRAARRRMIEANVRLVVSIASSMRSRTEWELADLVQDGMTGLIRAVDRFDPERGYRFSTYATWWIREAIGRGHAGNPGLVRLPDRVRQDLRNLWRAERELQRRLGRDATSGEIGAAMDMPADRVEELRMTAALPLSLNVRVGEDDASSELGDLLADEHLDEAGTSLAVQQASRHVRDLLATLPEREQRVLRERYGFGGGQPRTHADIAAELGLSRERVRQLEHGALKVLASTPAAEELRLALAE